MCINYQNVYILIVDIQIRPPVAPVMAWLHIYIYLRKGFNYAKEIFYCCRSFIVVNN